MPIIKTLSSIYFIHDGELGEGVAMQIKIDEPEGKKQGQLKKAASQ